MTKAKLENLRRIKVNVNSEFGTLYSVLVHDASTLCSIDKVADLPFDMSYYDAEKKWHPEDGEYDADKLRAQLKKVHDILEQNRVMLVYSRDVKDAWLQFFTRDVGAVVGETCYLTCMRHPSREIEQRAIENMPNIVSRYEKIETKHIEGGDIFPHGSKTFVGISRQTNYDAFNEFKEKEMMKGRKAIPVQFEESTLHMDCRFNIIRPDKGVLYGDDITQDGLGNLEQSFRIIDGPEEELKTLGSNFFIINPGLAISDQRNKWTIKTLEDNGYRVIPVDISEITKLWGGLRCVMFPLYREPVSKN